MSQLSQMARMREALLITEGNLSSLIGVRFDNGLTDQNDVMVDAMIIWRHVVRRALGHFPAEPVSTQ